MLSARQILRAAAFIVAGLPAGVAGAQVPRGPVGEVTGTRGQNPIVLLPVGQCVSVGTRVQIRGNIQGRDNVVSGSGSVASVTQSGGRQTAIITLDRVNAWEVIRGHVVRFASASTCARPATPPTPAVDVASVRLTSDPSGATVRSGGIYMGTTPYDIRLTRRATFELSAPSHRTRRIEVQPGQSPPVIRLERLPGSEAPPPGAASRSATLRIAGLAPNSRVTVNGSEVRWQGGTVTLPAGGTFIVAADLHGFYAEPQRVVIADGGTGRVSFEQVAATGTLTVRAPIDGALVQVDGSTIGQTPLTTRLSPGSHRIAVVAEGFAVTEEIVRIQTGEEVEISLALVPARARLRVRTEAQAIVALNGVTIGTGPVEMLLAPGSYDLRVQNRLGDVLLAESVEIGNGDERIVIAGMPAPASACELDPTSEACLEQVCASGRFPPACSSLCARSPERPECAAQDHGAGLPPLGGAVPGPTYQVESSPTISAPGGELLPSPAFVPTQPQAVGRVSLQATGVAGCEDVIELIRRTPPDYMTAAECLGRLTADPHLGPAAFELGQRLAQVRAAEASLSATARTDLGIIRDEVRRQSALRNVPELIAVARRANQLLPGDPYTLEWVRHAAETDLTRSGSPPLRMALVPGVDLIGSVPGFLVGTAQVGSSFLLSATEVTNDQFVVFLNGAVGERGLTVREPSHLRFERNRWVVVPGSGSLPAVDATWAGANAFARWLSGRLPTETDWLWAFRTGLGSSTLGAAVVRDQGARSLQPVPASPPDRNGISDLVGNAAEWLADAAGRDRKIAGGSFANEANAILQTLVSTRNPEQTDRQVGFRIMLPLSP